jgi:RNA polymerase sigma factor (sigma-70 family)
VFVRNNFSGVPDGELWTLASGHDGAAFGELFERHSDAVYNHCFRRTGSWSEAEDLTSVVFLLAWRRRREVRLHGESILPWLLAVANNATRNSQRSIRRRRRLLLKLPKSDLSPNPEDTIDERIDDERKMKLILSKLNFLKAEEREIISLCDWSSLSYSEAAVALNIPIGTVQSRLSRARGHLRTLLDDDKFEDQQIAHFANLDSRKDTHDHY